MLQEKQLYAVLTEMVQLDAYEDHGILAENGKPLMTCSDCEVNKNIYSFGTCKCGDIYIVRVCLIQVRRVSRMSMEM